MRHTTLIATVLFEALFISVNGGIASAQTVTWVSQGQKYNNGYSPAVATNGSDYNLSQHLGSPGFAELWYNPGTWSGGFLSGHNTGYPNYQVGGGSTGIGVNYQSLAGDPFSPSGHFITAYAYVEAASTIGIPKLAYLPGTLAWGSPVTWNSFGFSPFGTDDESCELGEAAYAGYSPSIAMATNSAGNQGVIVAFNGYQVYPAGCCGTDAQAPSFNACQSFSPSDVLYYEIGKLVPHTISWSTEPTPLPHGGAALAQKVPTVGIGPSVALWPITSGPHAGEMGVLEVHKYGASNSFASVSGHFKVGAGTITWDPRQGYNSNGSPYPPKVAVCSENGGFGVSAGSFSIVEVHNGGDGSGWMHVGRLNTDGYSANWGPNSQYVPANSIEGQPSVTCTGTHGIESHSDQSGNITRSTFEIN